MPAVKFDGVLVNRNWDQNVRDHDMPPPRKEAKKATTPQYQSGSSAK